MKIAISAVGDNLDSMMDPRFGRAAYFLFIDSDNLEFQSFINPYVEDRGGAGIQSAQFVLEKGAQVVITGSCGPNAYRVLSEAGIPVIELPVKSVRELVQIFKEKHLPNSTTLKKTHMDFSARQKNRGDEQQSIASSDFLHKQVENLQKKISRLEEQLREVGQRMERLENK